MSATTTNQNTVALDDDDSGEEYLALDAQAAYRSLNFLVQILAACKPEEQITGIFIHAVLADILAHLENVVSGLRVPSILHTLQPQDGHAVN
ncbi:MAG: hypothetical protein IPN53_05250 [Comamonadaceae bacterium]|nr:hypothetical protein [Comamonadaceae bacterium]